MTIEPPVDLRAGFSEDWVPLGGDGRSFQEKLAEFDMHAVSAVRFLIDWLRDEGNLLTVMARGRLAAGHYRYGDTLMFEYDEAELVANAAEELADAINYVQRLQSLKEAPR